MGAMRSASERQLLARDDLSGDGADDAPERGPEGEGPSMECLVTLLWATHVIDQDLRRPLMEEVDAATEIWR